MTQDESASEKTGSVHAFPEGFTWGSATSAFQIEGGIDVDGKSPSIWDTFCAEPGRIADGSNGALACDHLNRYEQDVALMSELGLSAYRFSVAWTRILPAGRGEVNKAGLDFYDRLVDRLLDAGIRPLPTLYHWDLPQVLQDEGGWLNRQTAEDFASYAEVMAEFFGDRVDAWTTLNEPFVSANHGYVTGEHAPGRTSIIEGFTASHHLLLGHGLAAKRIRSVCGAQVNITLNFTPASPASDSDEDVVATTHVNNLENLWYADPLDGRDYPAETADHYGWDRSEILDGDMEIISQPIDVLGVNFYTRQLVSTDPAFELPAGTPQNSMGWEIHAPSFGQLLRDLRDRYSFDRYMITENGAPMPDGKRVDGQIIDDDRLDYIRSHLIEVHGAIEDGCPIEGYLVWSLFDNFEWAHGYVPRFGIIEVDFETQKRTPKKSADWFSQVARTNEISVGGSALA